MLYALVAPAAPGLVAPAAWRSASPAGPVRPRIDPLRSDSIDFLLLGPRWLAVLGFSALAMFQGMLVVALASRWGSPPGGTASRARTVGRIALAVVALAALTSFVPAVSDILSSG